MIKTPKPIATTAPFSWMAAWEARKNSKSNLPTPPYNEFKKAALELFNACKIENNGLEPTHVIQAIEREDESYLVKFPGVGKKTARQMILDLKGKLNDLIDIEHFDFTQEEPTLFEDGQATHELEEAMLALAALGYS